MGKQKSKPAQKSSQICVNKKARFDFTIEESLEAGIALEGWEVKSLREGRVQLVDSYVIIKHNELWLLGCIITPLTTASTHITTDPQRTRKLLLNRREIDKWIGAVERKGYTMVALKMYWKKNRVKVEVGLAKGKKQHDKRAAMKERDWAREKSRVLKNG